jgi:hypothetical protein
MLYTTRLRAFSVVCLSLVLGCGQSASNPQGGTGGAPEETGGSGGSATGGKPATGGAPGTGGKPASTGGSSGSTGGSSGSTGGSSGGDTGGTSGTPDAGPKPDTGAGTGGAGGGDPSGLDKACTPKVNLKLEDTGPKGQIFLDAMGGSPAGVEKTVQQIGRDVCRVLYRNPSEVRPANEIELQIHDYDGVAAKWGDIGKIGVEISTRHIQNVKDMGRDVATEIKGILYHEMTHMYQHDDKPEGKWSGLANYYEAGAEAVRIRYGFAPAGCRPGDKGGNWYDKSYCGGGWWWLWVDTKYPDFIYKLNLQMTGGDGKAWTPEMATPIAGVSLDDLWKQYQAAACCNGANATCCK